MNFANRLTFILNREPLINTTIHDQSLQLNTSFTNHIATYYIFIIDANRQIIPNILHINLKCLVKLGLLASPSCYFGLK